MRRALVIGLAAIPVAPLWAQTGRSTDQSDALLLQQRLLDDQIEEARRAEAPLEALLDWQWGGWFDYQFSLFADGVQEQRLAQRPGVALWTRLQIDDGAHEIFARARLRYDHFQPGDEFDRQRDWVGPNFDRLFYTIDVGKALRLDASEVGAKIRVGRQEVLFGTGYALDLPLDAVAVDLSLADWTLTGLAGRAIPSYPNIDRSEPVDSHSARRFFGVQLAHGAWREFRPFAYAIWNDDFTDERPQDALQNYSYDTNYFGLGARGEPWHNLSYWGELVYESGKSFGDGDFLHQDDVDAWGFDLGVEYVWELETRPRVAFEYLFAGGDGDRVFNAVGAAGGNQGDSLDTGFQAFGFRNTGIASALTPTNLHVWRFSGSVQPFPELEPMRDFEIGSDWFVYRKDAPRGALSDSTADQFEGFAGWEMDYYFNWRLDADLAWTTRWGLFFPGEAFSDRDARSFLYTGLVWSF